jgi:hypothetical protein
MRSWPSRLAAIMIMVIAMATWPLAIVTVTVVAVTVAVVTVTRRGHGHRDRGRDRGGRERGGRDRGGRDRGGGQGRVRPMSHVPCPMSVAVVLVAVPFMGYAAINEDGGERPDLVGKPFSSRWEVDHGQRRSRNDGSMIVRLVCHPVLDAWHRCRPDARQ